MTDFICLRINLLWNYSGVSLKVFWAHCNRFMEQICNYFWDMHLFDVTILVDSNKLFSIWIQRNKTRQVTQTYQAHISLTRSIKCVTHISLTLPVSLSLIAWRRNKHTHRKKEYWNKYNTEFIILIFGETSVDQYTYLFIHITGLW